MYFFKTLMKLNDKLKPSFQFNSIVQKRFRESICHVMHIRNSYADN